MKAMHWHAAVLVVPLWTGALSSCATRIESSDTAPAGAIDGSPSLGDGSRGPLDFGIALPDLATAPPPPRCGERPTLPTCANKPYGEVNTPDATTFTSYVARRWVACGQSYFSKRGREIGVEFTADGKWYLLYAAVGGGLVRGEAFMETGTWVLDDQRSPAWQPFQLNMPISGIAAEYAPHPRFAQPPFQPASSPATAVNFDGDRRSPDFYVDAADLPIGTARCP